MPLRAAYLVFHYLCNHDEKIINVFRNAWCDRPRQLENGVQIIAAQVVDPYMTLYRGSIGTVQGNNILFYPFYKAVYRMPHCVLETSEIGGCAIKMDKVVKFFVKTDELSNYAPTLMIALSHQFRQATEMWHHFFRSYTEIQVLILAILYQWNYFPSVCVTDLLELRDFIWKFDEKKQVRLFAFLKKCLLERGIENVSIVMDTYSIGLQPERNSAHGLKRQKCSLTRSD